MITLDTKKLSATMAKIKPSTDLSDFFKSVRGKRNLSQKDVLAIDELTDSDINLILELAWYFKRLVVENPGRKKLNLLRGYSIINFFCEESTRTRSSFELAGKHLGADTINISSSGSSMKKGETINDTARTLSKLAADCIVIRDSHALAPAMIAGQIETPVINAGDGWHEHPTQGLLDTFTMLEEFGDLRKKTIAIVGDIVHSRVAGSLLRITKRLGMTRRLVAPPTLLPAAADKVYGAKIYHRMEEGITSAEVAYILRIQLERAAASYIPTVRDYSKLYCMNAGRLPLLKPNGIVMHPGPINREVDISTEVMDGPRSRVETQVHNGLCVRLALLYLLVQHP